MVTRARKSGACARCGEPMWIRKHTLPQGKAVCRGCRKAQTVPYGRRSPLRESRLGFCACCTTPFSPPNKKFCCQDCANQVNGFKRQFTPEEQRVKAKAHVRRHAHIRREKMNQVRDLSIGAEIEMRRKARKCRLCGCWMTDKPFLSNSKELDHIVPLVMGGTHTLGNVRVICKTCNVSRPKDGSDFVGPVTLWAQVPELDGLPLVTKTRRKPKPRPPKDPSTVGWPPDKKKWFRNIYWFNCRYCGVLAYSKTHQQVVCNAYDCQRQRGRDANDRWMARQKDVTYAEARRMLDAEVG